MCDSCEAVTINGIYCHETGCPRTPKPCRECGQVYSDPQERAECCAPAED